MKILEFLKYLLREIFSEVFSDIKEIFVVVTKKKTWVFICFIGLIISLFTNNLYIIATSGVLFLFFFITYEWQVFSERYIGNLRKTYWKKPKKK